MTKTTAASEPKAKRYLAQEARSLVNREIKYKGKILVFSNPIISDVGEKTSIAVRVKGFDKAAFYLVFSGPVVYIGIKSIQHEDLPGVSSVKDAVQAATQRFDRHVSQQLAELLKSKPFEYFQSNFSVLVEPCVPTHDKLTVHVRPTRGAEVVFTVGVGEVSDWMWSSYGTLGWSNQLLARCHSELGKAPATAASEPGLSGEAIPVVTFRILPDSWPSFKAYKKWEKLLSDLCTKLHIKFSGEIEFHEGDVHGVDDRDEDEVGSDAVTVTLRNVEIPHAAVRPFVKFVTDQDDYYGDDKDQATLLSGLLKQRTVHAFTDASRAEWAKLVIETEIRKGSKADAAQVRAALCNATTRAVQDAGFNCKDVSVNIGADDNLVISVTGLAHDVPYPGEHATTTWLIKLYKRLQGDAVLGKFGVPDRMKHLKLFVHDMMRSVDIDSKSAVTASAEPGNGREVLVIERLKVALDRKGPQGVIAKKVVHGREYKITGDGEQPDDDKAVLYVVTEPAAAYKDFMKTTWFDIAKVTVVPGKPGHLTVTVRGLMDNVVPYSGQCSESIKLEGSDSAKVIKDIVEFSFRIAEACRIREDVFNGTESATAAAEPQEPLANRVVTDLSNAFARKGADGVVTSRKIGDHVFKITGDDEQYDDEAILYVVTEPSAAYKASYHCTHFDIAKVVVKARPRGDLDVTVKPVTDNVKAYSGLKTKYLKAETPVRELLKAVVEFTFEIVALCKIKRDVFDAADIQHDNEINAAAEPAPHANKHEAAESAFYALVAQLKEKPVTITSGGFHVTARGFDGAGKYGRSVGIKCTSQADPDRHFNFEIRSGVLGGVYVAETGSRESMLASSDTHALDKPETLLRLALALVLKRSNEKLKHVQEAEQFLQKASKSMFPNAQAAAEPRTDDEPTEDASNTDDKKPVPYVHAVDGKIRGLMQLLTKWTAAEKNEVGRESLREILVMVHKHAWPRLSKESRKKLMELK